MSMPPRDRPEERAAQDLVEAALATVVHPHDDGSEPGMVDYLVDRPTGRAPLEVIFDRQNDAAAQHKALRDTNHVLAIPDLRSAWGIHLRPGAHLKRLRAYLATPGWEPCPHPGRHQPVPPDLARLGVSALFPLSRATPRTVQLNQAVSTDDLGSDPLPAWVTAVLADQDDVPTKLKRIQADERHVFIWATWTSSLPVQFELEDRGQPVPDTAPDLPDGVTHVWVAGTTSSAGCLVWFPDRGWWRVPTALKNSAWPTSRPPR
ncbi:hypothetical protein [Georgenia muralis]